MLKKKSVLFLLTGLFCLLLLYPMIQTNAAKATGTVKNRVVNVREDASTSSKIVCKLSQGTAVTINAEKTGKDGKKWYEIQCTYHGASKKGYIRSDLLNVTSAASGSGSTSGNTSSTSGNSASDSDTSEGSKILYVNKSSVRVREHAVIGSKIIANLEKGAEVKLKSAKTGEDGKKWSKVSFTKDGEKLYGYIRSDLLTNVPPSGTTVDAGTDDEVLYVNTSAVRVREKASDSSSVVANLLKGDEVKKKSTKTGSDGREWTKVSFIMDGTKYHGYIRSDLLSKAKKSSEGQSSSSGSKLYVTASAVRVRKSASTTDTVVANLLQGDSVRLESTKTGSDGKEWSKVSFEINGAKYTGYVRSDYLSAQKPANSSSTTATTPSTSSDDSVLRYVAVTSANLRDSASTSSAVLATLKKGQMVKEKSTKTGTDGKQWTKVSYTAANGTKIYGYIRSDLLK